MTRFLCALALVLALSLVVSSEGFRLKRSNAKMVGAETRYEVHVEVDDSDVDESAVVQETIREEQGEPESSSVDEEESDADDNEKCAQDGWKTCHLFKSHCATNSLVRSACSTTCHEEIGCRLASYKLISRGTCEIGDNIQTDNDCQRVAASIGLDATTIGRSRSRDTPSGCYYRSKSSAKKLWFNQKNGRPNPATSERQVICRQKTIPSVACSTGFVAHGTIPGAGQTACGASTPQVKAHGMCVGARCKADTDATNCCGVQYTLISSGTCADVGQQNVGSNDHCFDAGATLGLWISSPYPTSIANNTENPSGCYVRFDSSTKKVWFNSHSMKTPASKERRLVCLKASCVADGDCPSSYHCDAGECKDCVDNGHCPSGKVCLNNQCKVSCTIDSDCPSTSRCDSSACKPIYVRTAPYTNQCPSGYGRITAGEDCRSATPLFGTSYVGRVKEEPWEDECKGPPATMWSPAGCRIYEGRNGGHSWGSVEFEYCRSGVGSPSLFYSLICREESSCSSKSDCPSGYACDGGVCKVLCASRVLVTGAESVATAVAEYMGTYNKITIVPESVDAGPQVWKNENGKYLWFWKPKAVWALGSAFDLVRRYGGSPNATFSAYSDTKCPADATNWFRIDYGGGDEKNPNPTVEGEITIVDADKA